MKKIIFLILIFLPSILMAQWNTEISLLRKYRAELADSSAPAMKRAAAYDSIIAILSNAFSITASAGTTLTDTSRIGYLRAGTVTANETLFVKNALRLEDTDTTGFGAGLIMGKGIYIFTLGDSLHIIQDGTFKNLKME